MAKPRKTWGQLSKATRKKYADQAYDRFGLTRDQTRKRYNRGTFNPGSKSSRLNVPREYRLPAQGGTLKPSPEALELPTDREIDWKEQAYLNIIYQLGDYQTPDGKTVEFDTDGRRIEERLNAANEAQLIRLATSDAETIRDWAKDQLDDRNGHPGGRTKWDDDLNQMVPGDFDWLWAQLANGKWVNVAWYH